ncbi:BatA and WFA domain-containing protein [bacterium]|nr:BatA and WFA domain-containing protein [bacterium]
MLTFLNNIFIPVLAAAVLPILIHLFTRRRLEKRRWPSLRFLEEIQRRRMRRVKLKQLLLLVLRVLILLLVIGAFARPAIKGIFTSGVGAHDRTSVAILIDDSYSMGQEAAGVDLFTKARQAAEDIFGLLKEGDELWIVPFDDRPRPATSEPMKVVSGGRQIIDSLRISGGGSDVWSAVALATEEISKSRLLHREIYVLTDDKNCGWHRSGKLELPDGVRLYSVVFSPDDERNFGITGIDFPRTLLQKDVSFTLMPKVTSFAPNPTKDHIVDLYIDGSKVAQKSIDLDAGAVASVELKAKVEDGGFHFGEVRLEGDALPADNSRFFSFKIPERFDVLVVGGAESKFIAAALSPDDEGFFRVKRIDYRQLPNELLSSYDLLILSDPPELPGAVASAITGFVHRGGGFNVFFGGSPMPERSAKALFGDRFPIRVMATIGDTIGGGRLNLGRANFDHPVFVPFADTLPEVNFRRIAAIDGADEVPLTFSNGLPAIAEGSLGDGKVAICGFSVDLEYSDIATSGFFVPLIHRLSQYLAADVAVFDPGYLIDQEAIRIIENYNAGTLRLLRPSGSSVFLTPRFAGGKVLLNIGRLEEQGIYRVFSDSTLVDLFAVNVATAESDPEKLDRAAAERIAPIVWLSPDKDIAEAILSARHGRELHHGMLIAAFFLMLLELFLASTWHRPQNLTAQIHGKEGVQL